MNAVERPGPSVETRVVAYDLPGHRPRFDVLATEEPLEIRLRAGGATRTIAITMRTPGADFELAAGFLHNEGLVAHRDDVRAMSYCVDRDVDAEQRYNIVNVDLTAPALPATETLERHFLVSSACGVCGRAQLEALEERGVRAVASDRVLAPETVVALPERLAGAQRVFAKTGGLHAAALFDAQGELVAVREDVGRHNALDKLVGWALLERRLPLADGIVFVSGRSSYELVQKTVAAGAPFLCSVSAPSSLAVDVARRFGVTLVGFVRGSRFNVYTHPQRIAA